MSRLKSLFGLVILAGALSACGIHSKADDVPVPAEDKGIPGPNITGSWQSDCTQDPVSQQGKVLFLVFKDSSVSRKASLYKDTNCTLLTDERTENGSYIFLSSDPDGSFTVQYSIQLGGGWSNLRKEKVLLDGATLYVSDYVIGDLVTKATMIPTHKVAP